MSGSISGGSALQAAVDLAKYVIGVQTTTNSTTSGTSSSATSSGTAVSDTTDTNSTTQSETDTTGHTTSLTTTQNTTDPGVVASLRDLAQTAITNSTDPSKTTGILSGILQQAGDAMTSIFGTQKQAGIYDSSSANTQAGDILSRAGAQAASAILGYRTSQQQLADTVLNQLGGFLSGVTTNNQTDSNQSIKALTNTNTHVQENAQTNAVGNTESQVFSKTSSSSKTGMSVVCSWMYQKNMLTPRKYFVVTSDFEKKAWYIRKGYLTLAAPLVSILNEDHTNWKGRAIISIFRARTEEICAIRDPKGDAKKSLYGKFARASIAIICTLPSLYFWTIHTKNFLTGKSPMEGVTI